MILLALAFIATGAKTLANLCHLVGMVHCSIIIWANKDIWLRYDYDYYGKDKYWCIL